MKDALAIWGKGRCKKDISEVVIMVMVRVAELQVARNGRFCLSSKIQATSWRIY